MLKPSNCPLGRDWAPAATSGFWAVCRMTGGQEKAALPSWRWHHGEFREKNNLGEKRQVNYSRLCTWGAAVFREQIAIIIATLLTPSWVHLGDGFKLLRWEAFSVKVKALSACNSPLMAFGKRAFCISCPGKLWVQEHLSWAASRLVFMQQLHCAMQGPLTLYA